jgi:hypothetical protein
MKYGNHGSAVCVNQSTNSANANVVHTMIIDTLNVNRTEGFMDEPHIATSNTTVTASIN